MVRILGQDRNDCDSVNCANSFGKHCIRFRELHGGLIQAVVANPSIPNRVYLLPSNTERYVIWARDTGSLSPFTPILYEILSPGLAKVLVDRQSTQNVTESFHVADKSSLLPEL